METAIGVFGSRLKAEQALKELLTKQVPKESIVFLTTSETDATKVAKEIGAWAGGLMGGTAGMTAGAVASTLLLIPGIGQAIALGIGATALLGLVGAGAGSVVGKAAATEHQLPQPVPNSEDAELFARVLKDGRSLIIVRTEFKDVAGVACEILDRTGIGIQETQAGQKTPAGRMQAKTRHAGDVSVVEITGKITLGEGCEVLREVVQGLIADGKKNIVLNMMGADHIDSAGIGELVRANTSVHRAGGQFKLTHVGQKVSEMLTMTRLNKVLEIQPDEKTAMRSFGTGAGQSQGTAS
jgi:anti-sigma B factor antagonist